MQILTAIGKLKIASFSLISASILFAGSAPLGQNGSANGQVVDGATDKTTQPEEDQLSYELVESGDHSLSITAISTRDVEIVRDLQVVDLHGGAAIRLVEDPGRLVARRQLVSSPGLIGTGQGYGYFALVSSEEHGTGPRYDAVYVRFSDMRKFTIASGVRDTPNLQPLDRHRFALAISATAPYSITFDSLAGRVVQQTTARLPD